MLIEILKNHYELFETTLYTNPMVAFDQKNEKQENVRLKQLVHNMNVVFLNILKLLKIEYIFQYINNYEFN